MWGRLAVGLSAKTAEQELRALTNQLRRQHPKDIWDNEFIQSSPGGHMQVMQPEMYQVAAMVGVLTLLILAVACANLGGLLLARAAVYPSHHICGCSVVWPHACLADSPPASAQDHREASVGGRAGSRQLRA